MLSSLAADEKPSATATTKCTCSVNLGLESIEIRWLLDIFMVLVRKLPCDDMVWRQNTRGIIVSNEVANSSILFVILPCLLSPKRSVLIHDTVIGRCNGILKVPMCLWILF